MSQSHRPRWHRPDVIRAMFDRIAPRYDMLNRLLTLGMDVGWRRRAVRSLQLPAGAVVLDLACGTGDLSREADRAGHRAVGFDFAAAMLARARTEAPLVQADVLRLPVRDGAADGVTCGFALRNVADIDELFGEMRRALRPGGRIAVLEVSRPEAPLMRWGHRIYMERVVPFVGGRLSDPEGYRYLPESFGVLPTPGELVAMLARHGFGDVERTELSGGIAQLLTAARRD